MREALSSLQLPYALVPCATEGGSRPIPPSFRNSGGVGGDGRDGRSVDEDGGENSHPSGVRIPLLVDGDTALYGARFVLQYLHNTYAMGPALSYWAPASRPQ